MYIKTEFREKNIMIIRDFYITYNSQLRYYSNTHMMTFDYNQ